MNKRTKLSEFQHFNKFANEWWSENGKYKILHSIKPLRMSYIMESIGSKNKKKLNILDLGCGGGLVCESLAKLGCKVTGIDFVKDNIKVAKSHAKSNNLNITYDVQDLDRLNLNEKYDLIIMFEVLEHLDDWRATLKKIKKFLKKDGRIILSTINRNLISYILAIKVAENLLRWIPKNTHDYEKFIKPEELKKCLNNLNFSVIDFTGLVYHPISREWKFNKNKKVVNYFCTAKIN